MSAPTGPALEAHLRSFAAGRADGWTHDEWLGLLSQLAERGYDTSNPDSIGLHLERERIVLWVSEIRGVGPRRAEAIADAYASLWQLGHSDPLEISARAHVPFFLAQAISDSLARVW